MSPTSADHPFGSSPASQVAEDDCRLSCGIISIDRHEWAPRHQLPCIVVCEMLTNADAAVFLTSLARMATKAGLILLENDLADACDGQITEWEARVDAQTAGGYVNRTDGQRLFQGPGLNFFPDWVNLVRQWGNKAALYYIPRLGMPDGGGPVIYDMQRALHQRVLYGGMMPVVWEGRPPLGRDALR